MSIETGLRGGADFRVSVIFRYGKVFDVLLAQKAGHDLVPMGDRPSGAAWVAKFEAEIAQLKAIVDKKQQECDTLHLRAVTAEKTAADAIREIRDLKGERG